MVISKEKMVEDTRKKRKAYMRAILRVFPSQASQYTVQDVIWWMEELHCGHDTVTILSVGDGPQRMWELKSSPVARAKAQDVSGEWYGGPRYIKKYKGHLMQLLMDRILTEVDAHGTAYFLAASKRFRTMKNAKDATQTVKTYSTASTSGNCYDLKPEYDIQYTDVMGTSEWGGKYPFPTP